MKIKAVLFDLVGTTISERNPNLLIDCFLKAFNDNNISVDADLIKSNRGKNKSEIVKNILSEINQPLYLYEKITNFFVKNLENNLDNFLEMEGFREILNYLKQKDIIVGLGTGLPKDIFEKIFIHLRWNEIDFDYIGIAEETGRGRPYPDMIFDMMRKLRIDKSEIVKVGDTAADIQEGKNAEVLTAVILSGTQDEKEILKEKPDFVIRSLVELREIIN